MMTATRKVIATMAEVIIDADQGHEVLRFVTYSVKVRSCLTLVHSHVDTETENATRTAIEIETEITADEIVQ